ncbi:hypothetical protein H5410_037256 [Solanum commersonii]|uniref:Uncharacterized protein n=1 Tax=Solanum commersonii TaxID=4109 RepID=A0A9J5Y8Z8_SOLCO|nr:hypothetical protein H5410_037256 [Solanum commersonii]
MKEFAIVTGLRCHPPSEPLPKVARLRNPREKKISKSVKVDKKGKKPALALEAIPYLRKQFNDYSKEISQSRILRWLSAKNNPKINSVDLFDLPHDIIVHPWLVPTEQELQMPFFLTLGIINTKSDPTVDLIKKELAGAKTNRREAPIVSGDADDVALDVDVDVNIGNAGAKSGGEHVDDVGSIYGGFTPFSEHTTSFAPSSSSCSACKCEECKNKVAQLISTGEDVKKSLDALTSAVKELISKRAVIPSRKISEPFTPLKIKRRRKSISKILSNMKKRRQIATNPLPCNIESSSGAIEEQQKLYRVIDMLQYMTYLFGQISNFVLSLAWYCNMYSTDKPSVATDESSGAADDASVAINDLSVGRSFWFSPSLTWYCNMYPTAVQCDYQLKKKKMMNNQKKMVMNKKKKKNDDGEEE